MGRIVQCRIKARLENVEQLKTNHPNHGFSLKLKCTSCGEVSDKWHIINETEKFPGKTGRSETNYMAKCKLCSRENSIDIVPGSNYPYTIDDEEKFLSIVSFECRGFEPVQYRPLDGWIVKIADSNKVFKDVDLSEKEWVEYDDEIKDTVGIYDFEYKLV